MTSRPNTLKPDQVAALLRAGDAVLVDIREPDEFARRHAKGALSRPLSRLGDALTDLPAGKTVVFTCRSGMRTTANCERLAASAPGESFILDGGVDAWAAARLPLNEDRKAPLELMRQVQIAAGVLILAGVLLGFAVHPAFFGLSAFVGAGLTLAGATGFCGMARLLALAPWNRRAAA
jgi:rhodanese-related sulfurtransferase